MIKKTPQRLTAGRPSDKRAAALTKPETVRLTVDLDSDVHLALKILATQQRENMSDLVKRWIVEGIGKGGRR